MRIEGVDPERDDLPSAVREVLLAQARKWGRPLLNHLLYARRPSIFRGARAMWTGLDQSGLLDPALVALINRRVASLNGCPF
jgi:alkylhydroperoxidase family enzyme